MKSLEITPKSKIVILTGSGISAESGVPTFVGRDFNVLKDRLWGVLRG